MDPYSTMRMSWPDAGRVSKGKREVEHGVYQVCVPNGIPGKNRLAVEPIYYTEAQRKSGLCWGHYVESKQREVET